ncbi:AKR_collapsed_G0057890.mRNA.1.CDS.1 [Saccharomyces cerevisiae]|nr:AKR_collapsed_G0057890.mRNA.1.CDS.1 [Saccharomyces cerevisiae]
MVSFITSRQLKGLIENQRKDFQVVDLRREDFTRDHITNAWHVPVTAQITEKQLNQLIKRFIGYFLKFSIRQSDISLYWVQE